MKLRNWITPAVLMLSLSSCSTTSTNSNSSKDKFVDQAFQEKAKPTTPAPDQSQILESLMPKVTLGESKTVAAKRFDVKADKLPLNLFLMGLVEDTNLNILVDPNLTEPVTLQLSNVTIEEVLAVLERTHDIDVQQQGKIYYVGGSKLLTAVYPLDYLNLQRQGTSQTQVSSGQIYSKGQSQQNSGSNSGSTQGGQNNVATVNSSKIETASETNLWEEVQKALNAIASQDQDSMVMVSPQTGIVLVKARPMVQRQIAEYLGVAQANLGRQVILEAKILEVSLNDDFQAGVDWSQVKTNGAGNIIALGQLGQVLDTAAEANPINGVFNLLYETDPNDPNPFSATVQLLEQQGDVKVLSSPRISTINNQKAVIKVGTDEFFVTDISTTTTSGLNSTTTPDVTLTPFFSGIALDVMPQISANGEIILHVHPSVSEVKDQTKLIQIGDQDLSLPLALSSIRESDSIVKLRSGQVVVIGGLMQNQVVKTDSGVPVLSSIPVIGNLFKQQRDKTVKSELVLLLKATVIDQSQWEDAVKESKQRFERFNSGS
ncbi:pilus (MSHA type) biogenesis protein MshL [Pleionea litopenaei]|uniref:Pilus (MSHA type) biogenesis protein MshL n=1 Tax=Pleionea litopenaei TaxID=3070815 RepID=A0AA51RR21_9GAMM|nr:pilus (MSHA type) biogenesis protein MshL [Pleionea sp. HL-JVS1]WMS85949.1 pilus (MSHA type) biogenesis protein MshL [Pleionea sp. HL-JVS1]